MNFIKILWRQRRYRLIGLGRKIERRRLLALLRDCGVLVYKDGSVSVTAGKSTVLYLSGSL
jgi:hypothetical protein